MNTYFLWTSWKTPYQKSVGAWLSGYFPHSSHSFFKATSHAKDNRRGWISSETVKKGITYTVIVSCFQWHCFRIGRLVIWPPWPRLPIALAATWPPWPLPLFSLLEANISVLQATNAGARRPGYEATFQYRQECRTESDRRCGTRLVQDHDYEEFCLCGAAASHW